MGRDADTGVGDTQHGATVTQRLPADADLAALRGVTHRVADQIGERAVQFLGGTGQIAACRSEEHTSELQSLMRISYAVFCLKKKKELTTTLLCTVDNT